MGDAALISEIQTVSVAILLAMVASLWITGGLSSFATIQRPAVYTYADIDAVTGHPKIIATVSNQGARTLTIDEVTVTQGASGSLRVTALSSAVDGLVQVEPLPLRIPPGSRAIVSATLSGAAPGQTVEVRLHTTLGTEIYQFVILP